MSGRPIVPEDPVINTGTDTTISWHSMFSNMPSDILRFYDYSFSTDKIPLYFVMSAFTAGLIASDDETWRASKDWYDQSEKVKAFSDFFTTMGDGKTQFGLAGAFAVYGFITKDKRAIRTASQITEVVLVSGGIVQVLKHITGRESPESITKPRGAWRFFPNQIEYHKHVSAHDAFPSGHLTTTIATVEVVAENYPEIKWIRPVGYFVAASLAVSMVNNSIHWYSDYPLAIFLGYTFGQICSHPNVNLNSLSENNALKITPFLLDRGAAISINYSF